MRNNPDKDRSLPDDTPPDRGAAGDVSTTGHSALDADREPQVTHDVGATHGPTPVHADTHATHGASGAHGDDADEASEVSTIVPAGWKQLILPAIILIFVALLVAGPVLGAFAPRPQASPGTTEGNNGAGETTGGEGQTTGTAGEGADLETPAAEASPTTLATATTEARATQPPATPTTVAQFQPVPATQTAVALEGAQGNVARVPVRLEFGGTTFAVQSGTGLLPDWKPPQDEGTATWIAGTVANHILYLPFGTRNEAIFKAAKEGDPVKLTMNTGQVFSFAVKRAERATNGPPSKEGEFTVSTAMAQDRAGATIFLIGDPATDRAVVQADFTGDIQSSAP